MGQTNENRSVALDRLRGLLGVMLGDAEANGARLLGLLAALDDADRIGTVIVQSMGREAEYAEAYDVGVSLAEALEVSSD